MKFASLLVLSTALLGAGAVKGNLIVNGDFEDPPIPDRATGFQTYYPGQSLPGWTVAGDSIDVVSDDRSSWVSWNAASGHQSVDLNGYGKGSISQDLTTVPGQSYDLSFAMAANPSNSPWVVTMEFLWHGEVVDTISFYTHYGRDPGWVYLNYVLTAATDSARLTFGSLVNDGTAGAAIDDIVLTAIPPTVSAEAVPDLGGSWLSLTLLIPLGVGSIVQHRRRTESIAAA